MKFINFLLLSTLFTHSFYSYCMEREEKSENSPKKENVKKFREDTKIALLKAVKNNNVTLVQQLLLLPTIDINEKDDHTGTTPLINATENKNLAMVRLLLENGANINVRANTTALLTAVSNRWIKGIKLLLKYHSDINQTDEVKNSPLLKAVDFNNLEIVRMLLQYGAEVNILDSFGQTPLFVAVAKADILKKNIYWTIRLLGEDSLLVEREKDEIQRNREIIQLLLQYHANPTIANKRGISPLKLANFNKSESIIRLFTSCDEEKTS